MSGPVTVVAPAKVNLQLGVGGLRPDGFHTLATVYQAIALYDEVTVAPAEETSLTVVGEGVDVVDVPTDGSNLALRAAAALADHAGLAAGRAAVAMQIRKRIPVAGGMAGGSADAAAALLACDTLWRLGTPQQELLALAAGLGSDVPFCLVGGTALGTGRGEVVDRVADAGTYWWVVALPGGGLPTPAVYGAFDRLHEGRVVPEPVVSAPLLAALAAGDPVGLAGALVNDLQGPATTLRPDLTDLLDVGSRPPALAGLLSGSGPTCLFLVADEEDGREVRDRLDDAGVGTLLARAPAPGARVLSAL